MTAACPRRLELTRSEDPRIGTLDSVMLPPKFLVPDQSDESKSLVTCLLNFKSGSLEIAGLGVEYDMTDWVLAITSNLRKCS